MTKLFIDLQKEWMEDPTFNDFQKIAPGLFIGNRMSTYQRSKLDKEGIRQVLAVNGRPSFMPYKSDVIEKVVYMEDEAGFDLKKDVLNECFDFIARESTLVICTAGRSRSAAVCIGYLITRK